ncbi:MAG: dipeptide epimerase, partial [Bacteroidales bacterium]
MNNDRRKFIKAAALTSLGAYCSFSGINTIFAANTKTKTMSTKKMKLSFKPYDLQMKHTFTIAGNSRTMTPAVLTEIEYDGVTGYGEASMPPYLGETQASVIEFLKKVNLEQFNSPFELDDILTYVDAIAENNTAAKASIDIALHDLTGKLMGQPWHRIWGLNPEKTPQTSYTIGMDTPEIVRQKTLEAPYEILKVKLGAATDKELIESIRSVSQKPIYVDANQ